MECDTFWWNSAGEWFYGSSTAWSGIPPGFPTVPPPIHTTLSIRLVLYASPHLITNYNIYLPSSQRIRRQQISTHADTPQAIRQHLLSKFEQTICRNTTTSPIPIPIPIQSQSNSNLPYTRHTPHPQNTKHHTHSQHQPLQTFPSPKITTRPTKGLRSNFPLSLLSLSPLNTLPNPKNLIPRTQKKFISLHRISIP
ncbi:hypothetical protein EYC80_009500 [Monilinia laxa]|uniref:Uncharacterized protein n=1 Tax=Monilinia laxa TaxID=61186 RepID=A0A5N6JY10_MONLA|nr:hypothetical protein EYC80_009500 [Monilinia laxa]